ncbi:hypothetical protein C0Q70_12068 [Pomacea canaliculata]|uniref:Uncharacterized protein n=1 Tax=Pomacea canaliculata TaxID=400727 RepID=A0A2T7P0H3_POMCA|nr:hypothetical protein C0Q70_12068 [Pomacea canaliculata]
MSDFVTYDILDYKYDEGAKLGSSQRPIYIPCGREPNPLYLRQQQEQRQQLTKKTPRKIDQSGTLSFRINNGDDKWGEDEEQREEENILISHPVSLAGAEGSDICEAEDTDSDAEVLREDSWQAEVGAKPFNINNNSITQSEDEQPLSAPLKCEEEKDFGGFDPTNNSDELQDSLKFSHSDSDLSDNQFVLDRTLPVPNPPVESRKGIGDVSLTILISGAPRYSPAEQHRTLKSPSGSGKERSSMPTVKEPERVYVESPTFTREEEEQYRFVSSRVEDYVEHDHHPTFRGLDEGAVKSMEGASGRVQPVKNL